MVVFFAFIVQIISIFWLFLLLLKMWCVIKSFKVKFNSAIYTAIIAQLLVLHKY